MTLTAGDIYNEVDRFLRTENLPLSSDDIYRYIRTAVLYFTATQDVIQDWVQVNTTGTTNRYELPPYTRKVLSVQVIYSEYGSPPRMIAPVPKSLREFPFYSNRPVYSVEYDYQTKRSYLVFGFVPPPATNGLSYKVVLSYPNPPATFTATTETHIPIPQLRLISIITLRHILQSFYGDEVQAWIQQLSAEEAQLKQEMSVIVPSDEFLAPSGGAKE